MAQKRSMARPKASFTVSAVHLAGKKPGSGKVQKRAVLSPLFTNKTACTSLPNLALVLHSPKSTNRCNDEAIVAWYGDCTGHL